jgi:hypothetical protein
MIFIELKYLRLIKILEGFFSYKENKQTKHTISDT